MGIKIAGADLSAILALRTPQVCVLSFIEICFLILLPQFSDFAIGKNEFPVGR